MISPQAKARLSISSYAARERREGEERGREEGREKGKRGKKEEEEREEGGRKERAFMSAISILPASIFFP